MMGVWWGNFGLAISYRFYKTNDDLMEFSYALYIIITESS